MPRVALHTRLRPGTEQEYARVHATIPDVLDVALRGAGVHSWEIWGHGRDLFHLVEVEDYEGMLHALRDPVDLEWDIVIAGLVETPPEGDRMMMKIWELPPRASGSRPVSGASSALSIQRMDTPSRQ